MCIEDRIYCMYHRFLICTSLLDQIPDNFLDLPATNWAYSMFIPALLGALVAADLVSEPAMDEAGVLGAHVAEHAEVLLLLSVLQTQLAAEILRAHGHDVVAFVAY